MWIYILAAGIRQRIYNLSSLLEKVLSDNAHPGSHFLNLILNFRNFLDAVSLLSCTAVTFRQRQDYLMSRKRYLDVSPWYSLCCPIDVFLLNKLLAKSVLMRAVRPKRVVETSKIVSKNWMYNGFALWLRKPTEAFVFPSIYLALVDYFYFYLLALLSGGYPQ